MRGSGNGDLYIQVSTEVPIALNREQKELLEKFRKIENEKSNPSIKKFFQKLKVFGKVKNIYGRNSSSGISYSYFDFSSATFLNINSKLKILLKNLSIWSIIILIITTISYILF